MVSDAKRRSRRSAHLPQELVTEILLRLPVKSLVKFKCVCKEWFTLINDNPQFAKSQLQQSKSASGFICESSKPGILSYFNLDVEKEEIDFKIEKIVRDIVIHRDSCNGLLLLQKRNSIHQYYVCNPITHWHFKLPKFLPGNNVQYLCSSLVYDDSIHKYKVVITFRKSGKTVLKPATYKCGVFTILGNKHGGCCGSWRELEMPTAFRVLTRCQPLSANGVLHWMAYRLDQLDGYILLMDLASEEFRVISSPVPPTRWHLFLMEMKGSLLLSNPVSDIELELWVLNDLVKQEWSNKSSINIGSFKVKGKPCPDNSWIYPLLVRENPTSSVITFLCKFNEESVIYDLDIEQSKVENKGIGVRGSSGVIAHVNSLISC
ncbi:F-box protein At5g49610-like [Macadamia integrifolia]|uniref:F-box protein At5g49610-like n=1 Tax=Macadamia integrifolia TaxID=60698 RepID=UPI001C4E92EF|nr:F-box protein At5g49610-like [Macadamia integrifolia]